MKYLLDTHTWIWWHMAPEKLSQKVMRAIHETRHYEEMLLSAISLWEFCKLLEKQRLGISCSAHEWMNRALAMPKLRLVPLSAAIAYHSTHMPEPFHEDPADQIIVASAREENAVILTKDSRILEYRSVKSMW